MPYSRQLNFRSTSAIDPAYDSVVAGYSTRRSNAS
jgi:hypothetical protein